MAAALQLDLFADRLKGIGREEFSRRLSVALAEVALEMEAGAKRNATGAPAVRTGRLRQSIRASVQDGTNGPEIHLQAGDTRVSYAAIQEFGGTVRPTVSDFLRIPLDAALTASGVDRYSGHLRVLAPGGFYVRRASSGLYLFKTSEDNGPPWYKLVREVEIKGSRYLGRALNSALGSLQLRMSDIWRVALGGI